MTAWIIAAIYWTGIPVTIRLHVGGCLRRDGWQDDGITIMGVPEREWFRATIAGICWPLAAFVFFVIRPLVVPRIAYRMRDEYKRDQATKQAARMADLPYPTVDNQPCHQLCDFTTRGRHPSYCHNSGQRIERQSGDVTLPWPRTENRSRHV